MTTENHTLTLEDFWSLKTVSDVQVSPDGMTIAYTTGTSEEKNNSLHSAIWLAELSTGEARQFTSGEACDSQPRWSHDGSRIVFVSTRHEGKPQVFVINVRGGEPRRLTDAKGGAHSAVWSPDGKRLCYAANVESDRQKVPQEVAWFEAHPDADQNAPRLHRQATLLSRMDGRGYVEQRIHLFVIDDTESGEEVPQARQLTHGDCDDLEPAWSPDGALITFMSNRTADAEHNFAGDVWTVTVDGGELQRLTNENLSANSPAWSPDGQSIAFYGRPEWIANGYQDTHLWTVSRRGGDQCDVSHQLDQSCGGGLQPDYMWPGPVPPAWSPDGAQVYFLAVDHGDTAVFACDIASETVRRVSTGGADVASVQATPDGRLLICLASTPAQPFDIFAVASEGGKLRQVTHTNQELLDRIDIIAPVHVTCKGPDDWDIEGWLVEPRDGADHPLILHVHGGPYGMWGNTFYFQAQALASAGYASLYVNPRGSDGYGQAFSHAADWGEKDFGDLLAGIEAALARGNADPSRIGITGISYGGFMTNWALGHDAERGGPRFAAGVSVNGVSNFFSMYGVSDVTSLWFETEFGGPYWNSEERWQRYRHHSPITHVDRIEAPLLLLQSENDYRCPIEQGEQMLTALRMRHQTVELIRVPGASHVIVMTGTPHQRYFQWRLTLDWFDAYVKNRRAEHPAAVRDVDRAIAPAVPAP